MAKCIIAGALEFDASEISFEKNDLIIAADKGYKTLKENGIEPDLFVGDCDSLGYVPENVNCEILNVRKNDTDTSHAVDYGFSKGFRQFEIFGAFGGRFDHSFANVQLAYSIAKRGGNAVFHGKEYDFTVIENSKITFPEGRKGRISVFSLSDKSTGVYETGLSYSLENATLTNDIPLGVSNEFTGVESRISVENGALLIIYAK